MDKVSRLQQRDLRDPENTVLDALPGLMWRSGEAAVRDFFNQSWLAFTGRPLAEELDGGWMGGIHPDDLQRCERVIEVAYRARRGFEIEYRLRHFSGEYRWILDVGRPCQAADGSFNGFIGTCLDLTERKRMEKALLETNQALEATNRALRESDSMFKGLFEQAPDAIVAVDSQGKILLANQQASTLFGWTVQELAGQPVDILMPEMYRERHHEHISNFVNDPHRRPMGICMSLIAQRKDGSHFPVDITLSPLDTGNRLIVLATVRDTSSQKAAEEAIREREQLMSTAALSAPIVFFKLNRKGVVELALGQSLSRKAYAIEPVGNSIYDLYAGNEPLLNGFERALAGETVTVVVEAGGFIYESTYAPLRDSSGQVTGVVGVSSDVTRHRAVEDALRESESHFRTIFNDAILGICLVDLEGRIVESNPALQAMLGLDAGDLRGRHIVDLAHPDDAPVQQRRLAEMLRGERESFQADQRYITSSGQVLLAREVMSLFRSQEGAPIYGIGMVEDITAQKQIEIELAEVQRRLIDSAEVERLNLSQELHDGPLQDLEAMRFQLSALEHTLSSSLAQPEQAALVAMAADLRKVVQSIRSICGELRPPSLAPFGLEKAIRSHAGHFRDRHPEIRLALNLASDGRDISERVRLVLFRIYQQSMINIARHSQAKNVTVRFSLNKDDIQLRIRDDGQGFQVPGRWVDLVRQGHFGLVGSIERAESVGGRMEIRSAPGQGTEIHVTVPRREEEQVAVRERF